MMKINKLMGLTSYQVESLKKAGVTTIEKLLQDGGTPAGRRTLAKKTRISLKTIDRWVRQSDFYRIKGIAGLKTELLEASGIQNVKQLSRQKPEDLHIHMSLVNEKKKLVKRVPGVVQIKRWVTTARKINPSI